MEAYMSSGEYSDLTIVTNGGKFKAHKVVVISKAPALKGLIKTYVKSDVDDTQADDKGGALTVDGNTVTFKLSKAFPKGDIINLKDCDAEHVDKMLHFLYTGDYDEAAVDFSTSFVPYSDVSAVVPLMADLAISGKDQSLAKRSLVIATATTAAATTVDTGGEHSESEAGTKIAASTLITNLSVHKLAQRFDITNLCKLSMQKLDKCITSLNKHGELPLPIIKSIYNIAGKDNKNANGTATRKFAITLLRKTIHLNFTTEESEVCIPSFTGNNQIEELRFLCWSEPELQHEISSWYMQLVLAENQELKRDKALLAGKLGSTRELINYYKKCRHSQCRYTFSLQFEEYDDDPTSMTATLRCSGCRTRHYYDAEES